MHHSIPHADSHFDNKKNKLADRQTVQPAVRTSISWLQSTQYVIIATIQAYPISSSWIPSYSSPPDDFVYCNCELNT